MNARYTVLFLLFSLGAGAVGVAGCGDDDASPTAAAGAGPGGAGAGGAGAGGAAGAGTGGIAGSTSAGQAGGAGEGGAGEGGAGEGGAAGEAGAAGEGGAAGEAGQGGGAGAEAAPIEWEKGPSMKAGRFEHTSTLLPDGRVLVVGGQTTASMLDSTELLSADGASFSDGPKLPEPRSNHGAALLADGRVLIVGGGPNSSNGIPGGNGVLASALLFDPATNELTETAPLKTARSHFATARLADGRVLVAGGTAEGGDTAEGSEIYDPATGTWSEVSGPATATAASEATVLKDGKVLVVGGLKGSISKNVSLFDGTTWTKLPSTDLPRYRHSLAPLPSGGALVAAGLVGNGIFSSAVERLSGDLSAWSEAPDLTSGGDGIEKPGGTGTVALALPSGRVLVTGSYGPVGVGFGASRFASIYDETSDAWSEVAQPIDSRGSHSALRLQDGRVILIGGIGGSNGAIKTTERTKAPVE